MIDELKRLITKAESVKREQTHTSDAFKLLKEKYTEALIGTQSHQKDERERLWQAIQIVGKVESHLNYLIDEGKIAAKQIETLHKG